METTYISFSFNDKHYLVRESEITDRWPSITNRNVENLVLKNGFQYRATNIKEVTFLDFPLFLNGRSSLLMSLSTSK